MIQTYINQINEAIMTGIGQFNANINGIAQAVQSEDIETPYITVNGEDSHVFIDDSFDFGLYHKQRSAAYQEDYTKGFGENKRTREVQELALIVWGFTEKLTQEELKDYLLSVFPEFVRLTSISFDKKTIFNAEFKGVEYPINEDIFLFQIIYKVQYDIKKTCLEINSKFTN